MKLRGQKVVEITNTYLCKLCDKSLIGVGLDSIFTATLCRGARRCDVVKFETATGIHMVILGRWGGRKDLANEVDGGIATSSKFTNDFEFRSRVFVIREARPIRRLVGDGAKDFTWKGIASETRSRGDRISSM
jgi:hypothetical protein